MAADDVKDLGDAELFTQLASAKDDLFHLRFQHATGMLDNTAKLGQTRKQIARLNTELREREIAAAEALATQEQETAG